MLSDAFMAHVEYDGECWIWTGRVQDRYPRFGQHSAHRLACKENGPIPEGYEVDHLCERALCVRPLHLEAVTPEENDRRRRRATCHLGHPKSERGGRTVCKTCEAMATQRYRQGKALVSA